jgi:Na+/citrate or Na+/malate symporter
MVTVRWFFEKVDYSLEKPSSGMFGTGNSNKSTNQQNQSKSVNINNAYRIFGLTLFLFATLTMIICVSTDKWDHEGFRILILSVAGVVFIAGILVAKLGERPNNTSWKIR